MGILNKLKKKIVDFSNLNKDEVVNDKEVVQQNPLNENKEDKNFRRRENVAARIKEPQKKPGQLKRKRPEKINHSTGKK